MNKKSLTETDIRTKFITPAIVGANGSKWNVMTQVREEAYFTKGRVIVRGRTVKRGEAKKADYLLSYKLNLPLAIVEAKDNNHAVGAGMQQALDYAETLARWYGDFQRAWPQVARLPSPAGKQPYDARFKRLWEYYLAYCEIGFRARWTDVGQLILARPA